MRRSTDGRFLVLTLEDGHFYDEQGRTGDRDATQPLMRGTFARDVITMDLTGMGLRRTDEDLFKDNYKMLTMGQLQTGEDSLEQRLDARIHEQVDHLRNSLFLLRPGAPIARDTVVHEQEPMPGTQARGELYELAMNMARNGKSFAERSQEEMNGRLSQIARYRIERHRKQPALGLAGEDVAINEDAGAGLIHRHGDPLRGQIIVHEPGARTRIVVEQAATAWQQSWCGAIGGLVESANGSAVRRRHVQGAARFKSNSAVLPPMHVVSLDRISGDQCRRAAAVHGDLPQPPVLLEGEPVPVR